MVAQRSPGNLVMFRQSPCYGAYNPGGLRRVARGKRSAAPGTGVEKGPRPEGRETFV
jgi:hypothetical protein